MERKISSIREKLKIIVLESHKMGYEHSFVRDTFSQVIGKKYCWQTLDSFLKGKSQMSVSKFENLCTLLGVRNEFAKKGLGHPYIKIESNVFIDPLTKRGLKLLTGGIKIAASDADYGAIGSQWRDPVLQKELEFTVMGASMEPLFLADDILKCRIIEQKNEIKNGGNYVFSILGYDILLLKQALIIKNRHGEVSHIKLVSHNPEHPPFIVEPNQIKHIYHIEILQRKF